MMTFEYRKITRSSQRFSVESQDAEIKAEEHDYKHPFLPRTTGKAR